MSTCPNWKPEIKIVKIVKTVKIVKIVKNVKIVKIVKNVKIVKIVKIVTKIVNKRICCHKY